MYILLQKQKEYILSIKLQDEAEYELDGFGYLYQQQWQELAASQLNTVSNLNDALSVLLNEDLYYEYAVCLSPILDYLSRQLTQLVSLNVLDRDKLRNRSEPHPIVSQGEQLLDFLSDDEVSFNLNKSLALYHHNCLNPNKATNRLESAIEIAHKIGDEELAEKTQKQLEQFEEAPDPYERAEESVESIDQKKASTKEYQQAMADIVEELGYDLSDTGDRQVQALQIGIDDADPSEYFRYCENLRINYWSSSLLGKATGVTSLGTKVMWCEHGGTTMGISLQNLFNGFKNEYCDGCEHHCPRDDDWECTVEWVQEQEQDPEFQEVLDNIEENFPY